MEKVALQLYSLLDPLKADYAGTLKRVAAMGFDGVELSEYPTDIPAKTLAGMLDDLGFERAGAHIGLKQLQGDAYQRTVDYSREVGNDLIIIPGLHREMMDSRESWLESARQIEEVGKRLKEDGFELFFHNHWREFTVFGHEFGLDILAGNTSPEHLKLQLDICWAERANVSSVEYIRRHAGRCALLHMKDLRSREERVSTFLGNGIIDLPMVIKVGKATGVRWYTIEQENYDGDMFEEIEKGCKHLRELLA